MSDGNSHCWERQTNNQVLFGIGSPSDLLASDITALSFVGFHADGITQTTDPAEIQLIEVRAKTVLLHGGRRGTHTNLPCLDSKLVAHPPNQPRAIEIVVQASHLPFAAATAAPQRRLAQTQDECRRGSIYGERHT